LAHTILEQASLPVILIGGKEDAPRGDALVASGAISWVGKTSIAESAAIIRGAQHVYAGDTGMMHLAAALGTPVTSFWGCTRPNLGMSPWLPAAGSIMHTPDEILGGRPCSKLGNRCRHTPPCMETTARVYRNASVK